MYDEAACQLVSGVNGPSPLATWSWTSCSSKDREHLHKAPGEPDCTGLLCVYNYCLGLLCLTCLRHP